MTRREFVRSMAIAGLAFPSLSALLAACGSDQWTAKEVITGSPASPVTQALYDENPMVASGLAPEPGRLQVYNWEVYLEPELFKQFAETYGVEEPELTVYYNEEESVQKLAAGEVQYDIWFPTQEIIGKAVAGGLIQPLNHTYLPNLTNVWPALQDPFYDKGSRYTVPYVIYHTGIGWRTDQVDSADIEDAENPWDVFWNPKYKGITGLFDDFEETLQLVMFRNGVTDPAQATQADLDAAVNSLTELVDLMDVRYSIQGSWLGLPEGWFGLHEAWSGDLVTGQQYVPEGGDATVLRYLWPGSAPNSKVNGLIANDTLAVVRGAEHPVQAHMFLNFLLDVNNAFTNYAYVGYQPPLTAFDPETLVADGWVPDYLTSAVVREEDFTSPRARLPINLSGDQELAWLEAWEQAQSGASIEPEHDA